jgi:hypothetical protein
LGGHRKTAELAGNNFRLNSRTDHGNPRLL